MPKLAETRAWRKLGCLTYILKNFRNFQFGLGRKERPKFRSSSYRTTKTTINKNRLTRRAGLAHIDCKVSKLGSIRSSGSPVLGGPTAGSFLAQGSSGATRLCGLHKKGSSSRLAYSGTSSSIVTQPADKIGLHEKKKISC